MRIYILNIFSLPLLDRKQFKTYFSNLLWILFNLGTFIPLKTKVDKQLVTLNGPTQIYMVFYLFFVSCRVQMKLWYKH